ncbi:hypothetical protein BJX76DRAFT_363753 [Aspergillus varians]
MPSASLPSSLKALVEFKSYSEKVDYSADGKPEPNVRSQTLIYHSNGSQWWIKVTLRGDAHSMLNEPIVKYRTSKRECCNEFQTFVRLIDHSSFPLLDDTVAELILDKALEGQDLRVIMHAIEESTSNPLVKIAAKLRWAVQEDSSRVVYPLCDEFPSFWSINLTEFSDEREITDGVFQVLNIKNKMPYILKIVICKELKNLEIFQSMPNIVQAAGIARIMSEYCLRESSCKWWGLQITTILTYLHRARKTHMDIKPSNVVLDADGNTVLINISGIGGIAHGWRAPEIRDKILPSELPFKVR